MTLPTLKEAYGKGILMPCETVHKKGSQKQSIYQPIPNKKLIEQKDTGTHLQWEFQVFQNTTQKINVFLDFQLFNFLTSTQHTGLNKHIAVVKYWEIRSLL